MSKPPLRYGFATPAGNVICFRNDGVRPIADTHQNFLGSGQNFLGSGLYCLTFVYRSAKLLPWHAPSA